MAIKGKPYLFSVKAFNAENDEVPVPQPVTIGSDNGAVQIDADGNNGIATPTALGPLTLTATAGGFTDTLVETVNADPTVTSIKIVPA